jgi:hypothetical protein
MRIRARKRGTWNAGTAKATIGTPSSLGSLGNGRTTITSQMSAELREALMELLFPARSMNDSP